MRDISPSSWVYQGRSVSIGAFRCPEWHERWRVENVILDGPEIVFGRNPVRIRHQGGNAVLADSTMVMLYNQGQVYRRECVAGRGEKADWFSYAPETIADAVADVDPGVRDRGPQVWRHPHAPLDARLYAWQRSIFEAAQHTDVDHVWVEEQALALLRSVAVGALGARRARNRRTSREDTRQAHADVVSAAKEYLATRFRERVSLDEVARAASVSSYHLCRVFRAGTGLTVHGYVEQLRVRAALEELERRRGSLLGLALELGFSSHAHFTGVFTKVFGVPPSAVGGRSDARRLAREMSKRMEATPG